MMDIPDRTQRRSFDVVLVLSGGNALGAFEAGVYQALHENDLLPDWIIGASIGAINGALIAGSAPDQRLDTLRTFWQQTAGGSPPAATLWWASQLETLRRTTAAAWTTIAGRSGIFGPVMSATLPWTDDKPSIFDTDQLAGTLNALVDFAILNEGGCRFTATAVDLSNGEDVVFDSHSHRIHAGHIRASAALPIAFPAVEIDGRWLVDGGLSANLPLDPVLSNPPNRPTLCIAVDLLPLGQALPVTIGDAASRMQDLIFSAQSRRSLARWVAVHHENEGICVALVRLDYTDQSEEVAGKAMDFSALTIARRWDAGYRCGLALVRRVADRSLPIGVPGLNIVSG